MGNRDNILLQCSTCKRRNYATTRNRKKTKEKLELKKFCRHCRSHQLHVEVK